MYVGLYLLILSALPVALIFVPDFYGGFYVLLFGVPFLTIPPVIAAYLIFRMRVLGIVVSIIALSFWTIPLGFFWDQAARVGLPGFQMSFLLGVWLAAQISAAVFIFLGRNAFHNLSGLSYWSTTDATE